MKISKKKEIPVDLLRTMLSYDPETGVVTWLREGSGIPKDKIAGSFNKAGYGALTINGGCYRLHRVIWALYYGEWPDKLVDHRDTNRSNNKIDNLRLATNQENKRNGRKKTSGTSLFRGVSWSKCHKKWHAQARKDYIRHHLGLFDKEEDAAKAYDKFARENYGEFANLNYEE